MTFLLTSPAFTHQGNMAAKYTCEGQDISPELNWVKAPSGTKTYVLIVDDPDAPDPKAPKMTYVHWLLYNIPVSTAGLPESCVTANLPGGTKEGTNDWNRIGYGGPCPPIGRHRYFFKLYALDTELPDLQKPSKTELLQAMKNHVLGEAQLIGTYQKEKH